MGLGANAVCDYSVTMPPSARSRLVLLAFLPLGGCTLESFDLFPCQAGETVGFAIAPIDGMFSDYQPRPYRIWIRPRDEPNFDNPPTWASDLVYDSLEDDRLKDRPALTLIRYGERMAGWDDKHAPQALVAGVSYSVHISDGGQHGWAEFEMGKPLPACPR